MSGRIYPCSTFYAECVQFMEGRAGLIMEKDTRTKRDIKKLRFKTNDCMMKSIRGVSVEGLESCVQACAVCSVKTGCRTLNEIESSWCFG